VTDIEPGLVGRHGVFGGALWRPQKAAKLYEGADALTPDDIAEAVHWVATLPARVNITPSEMMPVTQAFAPLAVHREPKACTRGAPFKALRASGHIEGGIAEDAGKWRVAADAGSKTLSVAFLTTIQGGLAFWRNCNARR